MIYSNVLALDGFVEIGTDIEVNNLRFSVGTYNGERTAICAGLKDEQEITDLIIPDEIVYEGNKYPVIEIRQLAFNDCSGLTSLTIPESVTSIGYSAFSGCSGLTSVTIPNSVTKIEGEVFWGCSSLISVIIPNSVTSIGIGAFTRC